VDGAREGESGAPGARVRVWTGDAAHYIAWYHDHNHQINNGRLEMNGPFGPKHFFIPFPLINISLFLFYFIAHYEVTYKTNYLI